MGLYLCIFDGEEELDGVDAGLYADFGYFRDTVCRELEGKIPGSRFPTLNLHSDCDGQWSPEEARELLKELAVIEADFRCLPPCPLMSEWQRNVAKKFGLRPRTFHDCFFDVDGELLLSRLVKLAKLSGERSLPILFQ